MVWYYLYLFARLTRLDTCSLVFFSVALPLYYVTSNERYAVTNALPILTTAMSGFVINDIHDIEKDRQNHPERPLPSRQISVACASGIYFALVVTSLALVKIYVADVHVYLYLFFLVSMINYNYVVSHFSVAKNIYVAAVAAIPIIILAALIPNHGVHWIVIISLFLSVLGREILMDIEDTKGDGDTLVKRIGLVTAEKLGLTIRAIAVASLSFYIHTALGALILCIMILSECISSYFWIKKRPISRSVLLFCMKVQLLLGLYYLL